MKLTDLDSSGAKLHQILTVFDDIRRKVIKGSSAQLQKKLYGLTLRQGAAINQVMLLTQTSPEGVALKTLAQNMQMAVSATSILVESMVIKGLFVRVQNPVDRRAVCIRLSENGEKIFLETHRIMNEEVSKLAKLLSEEELSVLDVVANKLSAASADKQEEAEES